MSSPLPPDPYAALGVPKNATTATIKGVYRKLVLKCHPDKVTDEALKQKAADEFHKIQQAYEILSDDDKRATYDAQVRLADLRREVMEGRGGSRPRVDTRTATFEMRTGSAPAAAYAGRPPLRVYEERRPSYDTYYDDPPRASSRKHSDGYDSYSRRTPPHTPRFERRTSDRDSEKVRRSEQRRTREKDERRDRDGKYASPYVEDDEFDGRLHYEEGRRRRDREEAERTSRRDDSYFDYNRKEADARVYMAQTTDRRSDADVRPQIHRTTSSRDPPRDYEIRRSSARPKDRSSDSRPRAREEEHRRGSIPEVVERSERTERRPPTLQTAYSSPADIKTVPQRSRTTQTDFDNRPDYPPHPTMRRSETMPSVYPSPTRRKDTLPTQSSRLRNSESIPHDSGCSSTSSPDTPEHYPTIPPPTPQSSRRIYHYPSVSGDVRDKERGGGVPISIPQIVEEPQPYEPSGGYRTVTRSPPPSSSRARASSARYPGPTERSSSYAYSSSTPEHRRPERPGLVHSQSTRAPRSPDLGLRERDRERDRDRDRDRERDRDRDRDRDRERDRERSSGKGMLYGEYPPPPPPPPSRGRRFDERPGMSRNSTWAASAEVRV